MKTPKDPKVVVKRMRKNPLLELPTGDQYIGDTIKEPLIFNDRPKHALFGSPSGLYALEKCPGKIAFGKDIPESPTSEYALEGTVFHEYMEMCLPFFIDGKVKDVDTILQESPPEYPDMVDYIWSTLEEVRDKWVRFNKKHALCEYHLELKIEINEDIYGTCDVVFTGLNNKTKSTDVIVIDYKYGKGVPVQAEENLQGIAYLLGAINTLKLSNVGIAMVFIAQVRLDAGWSDYSIASKDLSDWEQKILSIVFIGKEIYNGELPVKLNAGSHCRFCKCRPVCPENKKEHYDAVVSTATEIYEDLPTTVQKLTLDQQVSIFLKKTQIEDFLEAVAKNLTDVFQAGIAHERLKLIRTAGRRVWGLTEEQIIEGLQKLGVTNPAKCKAIGIGEAEKILGKTVSLDHLTTKSDGKLQLVRAEDKRPGVSLAGLEELPE